MKNSHITIIAVLVGSTFLLATTGCDADNSSDSMHDEEQSEALGKDTEMPGVAMPGVALPSAATPDHSETSDDAHMHSDDQHSATTNTQQPADTRKVTVEAEAETE